uniref:Uncharacterized protein n=1 Tax=Ixodes ricinus TaxID=34613 RepID=A0A6B0ULT7_IXORI
MPPAKRPAKPAGTLSLGAAPSADAWVGAAALLLASIMGALRSLVTAFLSVAPPRIWERSTDRSGTAAALGGPRPPMGGGGGGGAMAWPPSAPTSALFHVDGAPGDRPLLRGRKTTRC